MKRTLLLCAALSALIMVGCANHDHPAANQRHTSMTDARTITPYTGPSHPGTAGRRFEP